MSDPDDTRPRRRRRRATSRQGPPRPAEAAAADGSPEQPAALTSAVDDTAAVPAKPKRARASARPRDPGERALRDLVGNTPSQLGPDGAMRGRDVNRPGEDDLADAERDVVIVRRHWTPPT